MTGHWYGLMNGGSNMAQLLFHLGQRDRLSPNCGNSRPNCCRGAAHRWWPLYPAHLLLAGETTEAMGALREAITFARAIGLRGALGWAVEVLALDAGRSGPGHAGGPVCRLLRARCIPLSLLARRLSLRCSTGLKHCYPIGSRQKSLNGFSPKAWHGAISKRGKPPPRSVPRHRNIGALLALGGG